jgi:hypothetical protein
MKILTNDRDSERTLDVPNPAPMPPCAAEPRQPSPVLNPKCSDPATTGPTRKMCLRHHQLHSGSRLGRTLESQSLSSLVEAPKNAMTLCAEAKATWPSAVCQADADPWHRALQVQRALNLGPCHKAFPTLDLTRACPDEPFYDFLESFVQPSREVQANCRVTKTNRPLRCINLRIYPFR